MCGIIGIVAPDRAALRPLAAMTAALRHRGPDDEGYLLADTRAGRATAFRGPETHPSAGGPPLAIDAPEGCDLGFGHRRLSIIDLTSGGHGPMSTPTGSLWVTYNGEIFNYVELREELRAHGATFRTASDTEVLLAAYARWGEAALDRFNGMWAFAIYDAARRVVFCARDRFGVKPFHYFSDGTLFAFASEIKSLLRHPAIPRMAHAPSVYGFLTQGALDETGQTFFEGIRSLPAGHTLTLDLASREHRVRRWYELPPPEERSVEAARFRDQLEDAVRIRLRSDVDVGTCLSGGLDSSSIVALTGRLQPPGRGRRRSFTVLYSDNGLNEAPFVESILALTGVEGTSTTPVASDLAADLPALIRHQDEPFPSTAVYSQWRVMRLAKESGVKVLLDGQGADELLAGYHYHYGPHLAELAARRGLTAAASEARRASRVTGRPLMFFLALLAYHRLPFPRRLREYALARYATHRRLPTSLLDAAFIARAGETRSARHHPQGTLFGERKANILATSLPALLRYEDRNSMAFSVEARTPFLDYRLVETAMRLPATDLIRDGWTKAILREAMRGLLPEDVRLRRDKLGFATPETRWLREIAPRLREWLGPGARVSPFLDRRAWKGWFSAPDDVFSGRPGLFRLLSVELWLRYVEETVHAV